MTIAEVSKRMELSADTLRYYERIGLLPKVKRTSGGIRDYSEGDLKWISFVKCMRQAGLPVETIIEYVSLFQMGDETQTHRKSLLIEQRKIIEDRIEELKITLSYLNKKIDGYEDLVVPAQDKLRE